MVFCHGDPGPWNFIWHDNGAVGLIDWDYLHPSPRLASLPSVPDRLRRVRTFVDAYGDLPAFDVVDLIIERIRSVIRLRRRLAEQGVEPQRTWLADGAEERDLTEIDWIASHREELTA